MTSLFSHNSATFEYMPLPEDLFLSNDYHYKPFESPTSRQLEFKSSWCSTLSTNPFEDFVTDHQNIEENFTN